MGRIDCFKCKHFYITFDQSFPRGCRALNFKCREMPSDFVRRSSGLECQAFESKDLSKNKP